MYAIVDIAGQQFKVTKDQKIFVHRLEGQEGAQVSFNRVLLIDNDGDVKVGLPTVEGASVNAKILSHDKGDKVLVFKKKKRKSYQKLNGHRQSFTKIQIEEIIGLGASAAPKAKKKSSEVTDGEAAPVAPKAKRTSKKAAAASEDKAEA
jgi:large subunit ribosomal protein L21